MARGNDDRLNRILREWLDRTVETDDREALRERISRAVEEVPPQPHRGRESVWRSRRASRAIYAMAAAAVVLLIAAVWQMQSLPKRQRPSRDNDPAHELLAQLDADELQRRLALLDQLDELFDDRWEWMVECGDRVEMHVAAKPSDLSYSAPVAVRLTVLVRDDPGEPFRVQEKTFVLTREQQAVEAVLEDGVDRKLYFWAFPVDDGLFTYDVDLQTKAHSGNHEEGLSREGMPHIDGGRPQELSISSSGVVAAGRPTKILAFKQSGSEYRVYLLLVPGSRPMASTETRQL